MEKSKTTIAIVINKIDNECMFENIRKIIREYKNVNIVTNKIANFKKIDSNTISFGVAPRINACGRMGAQEEALKLFLTEDKQEALKIAKNLVKFNQERQTQYMMMAVYCQM